MPPKSKKQQKFMGAELARKRAGEATETGMSEANLEEFATKPAGKTLPVVAKPKKAKKKEKKPKRPLGLYEKR